MANELNITLGLVAFTKAGKSFRREGGEVIVNVSGNHFQAGSQSVGTSEEGIGLGDITSLGWFALRNLDATNKVYWGNVTGQLNNELLPGERVYARAKSGNNAIRVQADTAACEVEFAAFSA
jgi:hypothetical protein